MIRWLTALTLIAACPATMCAEEKRWGLAIWGLSYHVEWRSLNAADFGAPTNRRRLFLIARRDGQPIVWPDPTHGPGRKPYKTAASCIDWTIPCPSIFDRKRPLAEKTMRRITWGSPWRWWHRRARRRR